MINCNGSRSETRLFQRELPRVDRSKRGTEASGCIFSFLPLHTVLWCPFGLTCFPVGQAFCVTVTTFHSAIPRGKNCAHSVSASHMSPVRNACNINTPKGTARGSTLPTAASFPVLLLRFDRVAVFLPSVFATTLRPFVTGFSQCAADPISTIPARSSPNGARDMVLIGGEEITACLIAQFPPPGWEISACACARRKLIN